MRLIHQVALHERAVLLKHGLPIRALGPGRHSIWGFGLSVETFDTRELLVDLPEAIRAVFGESADDLVVSSTKSATGHLLGASGALEAAFAALACRDGVIPPTINYETPDPDCDLEYATRGAMERPVGLALSNSFGFGGHNVCLAVRRWDE